MQPMQPMWVSFLGICTHIWEDQPDAEPHPVWGHRIVLVNASNPDTINNNPHLNKLGIKPHIARMQIFNEQIVSIQGPAAFYPFNDTLLLNLDGVTVQIVNNGQNTLAKEAECMPQLGGPQHGVPPVTGIAPGPAVTMGLSALASCYFDFAFGEVLGTVVDKSPNPKFKPADCGVLLYQTQTIGNPQILITPFEGGVPTVVTLHNSEIDKEGNQKPAGMNIMNTPNGADKDNPSDFMLHYLAANKFPDDTVTVSRPGCPSNPFSYNLHRAPIAVNELGPGCSASNLP